MLKNKIIFVLLLGLVVGCVPKKIAVVRKKIVIKNYSEAKNRELRGEAIQSMGALKKYMEMFAADDAHEKYPRLKKDCSNLKSLMWDYTHYIDDELETFDSLSCEVSKDRESFVLKATAKDSKKTVIIGTQDEMTYEE